MHDQHYTGRIAEWYDDFVGTSGPVIDFYRDHFTGFMGRVLEVACGTGRVLLPIAQSSVAIDGLDASREMLDLLTHKAHQCGRDGIALFQQPMESFTLPGTYDAIIIPGGSFQLLTTQDHAVTALHCISQHLSDGGFLLLDLSIPWGEIRTQTQRDYQMTRDVTRADGQRGVVMERFAIDLPQQIKRGTYRYEFYEGKRLVESLLDTLDIRWYWKEEMVLLLHTTGFSHVQMVTDTHLAVAGEQFVFKAWK